MKAKTGAKLEVFNGETLHGTKDDFAQPTEFPRAKVTGAVPRCHCDELDVKDVARFQGTGFWVVNQASSLRFAVGVKMEPLIFIGVILNRFLEPVPVDVLDRNRGEYLVLLGLVGLRLLDLLKKA